MVLQDLGDAPSESFDDNPYPSDNDPYASSASGSNYDASSLPQPIPVLGPLLGFSQGAVRFRIGSTIKFAEHRIGRVLTSDEAQALAGHLHTMEQKKSYFTAAGVAAGTYRWYATMAVNRYPFYLPKPEDINPNKFMFVKGPAAQYARHSWRLLLYTFCVGELGRLVGQIVAQPLAAKDTATDPRLTQFGNDLKAAVSKDHRTRRDIERGDAKKGNQQTARPFSPPRRPISPQAPPSNDDDMSPTAGNEPWPSSSSSYWENASDPPDTARTSQQPTQSEDNADVSPTGGHFREEVQQQARRGESAWDRVRRGKVSVSGQHPPPKDLETTKPQGSTLGDSWTFAESEEERKRARERAQSEFDARVERERQGKDFNDERRW